MRKKLFIGLFVATIVGIAAGDYLFNRSGAQDAPRKADKDEKKNDGDLFDILKKELDAKKDSPPAFPPLQGQGNLFDKNEAKPPLQTPTPIDPKDLLPPPLSLPMPPKAEVKPKDAPLSFPPLNGPTTDPKDLFPPPMKEEKPKNEAPFAFPPLNPPTEPPLPPVTMKPDEQKKTEPDFPPGASVGKPYPIVPGIINPPITTDNVQPAKKEGPSGGLPPEKLVEPPEGAYGKAPTLSPKQPIAEQVAKIKDCPWKLHVEMVDGRTVVTATVNQKHEFKIVCQSLDLQTEKGILKASGKVQVSGAEGNASCDQLTIPLMEDRLIFEGSAVLTTPAIKTTGEKVTLQMQSERIVQTSAVPLSLDMSLKQAMVIVPALGSKNWTSYGVLRRTKEVHAGQPIWCLETHDGRRLQRFITPQGKSLDGYEGRNLSAYVASSDKGIAVVTHIALP